jgi:bacterioferritin (cytochrome b1)
MRAGERSLIEFAGAKGGLNPRYWSTDGEHTMQKLAEKNPQKVIDVLAERFAFERASVKLYDAAIGKMRASNDDYVMSLLGEFVEHRRQEQEHAEWLEQEIVRLGGNPEEQTDLSRIAETQSQGLAEIISKSDATVSHVLRALLAAELVDNAGWELLLELADEADDAEARAQFKCRLHEEEDHLMLVRRVVEVLAAQAVLGIQTPAANAP